MPPEDPYLTTDQAAEHLGIPARTLIRLRRVGGGPPFCQLVRLIRYRRSHLDDWADLCRADSSAAARAGATLRRVSR